MSEEQCSISAEIVEETANAAPCCQYRRTTAEDIDETEFLLSIPRNISLKERRGSNDSARTFGEADDASTRVEVSSLPGNDQTESMSVDDQLLFSTDGGDGSQPSTPVTEEPMPGRPPTRSDSEPIPLSGLDQTAGRPCSNFNCSIVCEANESMASDNYLRDYYEQLPSETADFSVGEPLDSGDFGHQDVHFGHQDTTSVLQPEVVPRPDPYDQSDVGAAGGDFGYGAGAAEFGGGHPMFEPVPAAAFEPEPQRSESETPSPQPLIREPEALQEVPQEPEIDAPTPVQDSNIAELDNMSAEQQSDFAEQPESPEGDQEIQKEAEPQPVVEAEVQQEEGDEKEDNQPEEPPPKIEIKEEVRDTPAPAVEDIDVKPAAPAEPVSLAAHCPAPDEKPKEVAAAKDDDPVVDLLYWRDIKKTAFVFSFLLLVLCSLTVFSIISVAAYVGLALLIVTVAFRLYRLVLQTLNGTQQPHPFQELLDLDITLSPERVQKYADTIQGHVNCTLTAARDLFLVRNTISSLKLGVFLWLMTYVGCLFNGLTILIIDVVLAFMVPPIYEKYQTPIDSYCCLAKEKVSVLMATVKAKMPGAKQAAKEKAQ